MGAFCVSFDGSRVAQVQLGLYLVLCGLFVALGLYLLIHPGRSAEALGDRDARRAFRPRDARAIGLAFAIGGGVLLILGVLRFTLAAFAC